MSQRRRSRYGMAATGGTSARLLRIQIETPSIWVRQCPEAAERCTSGVQECGRRARNTLWSSRSKRQILDPQRRESRPRKCDFGNHYSQYSEGHLSRPLRVRRSCLVSIRSRQAGHEWCRRSKPKGLDRGDSLGEAHLAHPCSQFSRRADCARVVVLDLGVAVSNGDRLDHTTGENRVYGPAFPAVELWRVAADQFMPLGNCRQTSADTLTFLQAPAARSRGGLRLTLGRFQLRALSITFPGASSSDLDAVVTASSVQRTEAVNHSAIPMSRSRPTMPITAAYRPGRSHAAPAGGTRPSAHVRRGLSATGRCWLRWSPGSTDPRT